MPVLLLILIAIAGVLFFDIIETSYIPQTNYLKYQNGLDDVEPAKMKNKAHKKHS
jgi:hypothetical protein